MLKRTILLLAAATVLHSCGNKNENNNPCNTDSLKTDSVAAASVNTSPAAPVNFTVEELMGAWMAIEGDCYAEEIDLDPGGAFSSYLHAKPFSDGTWSLENNKLIIKLKDNTELKYTARMDESKMILTLTDEAGKVSVYEAIVGC